VPFDRFMADALYGPAGFYTSSGRAGRRGDFITSPEVGPLFGAVLARFVREEWLRLGQPAAFTVVDAGAGPGALARAMLAADPDLLSSIRYVAVELSETQRDLHPDGVESRGDLPDGPFDGVIVANELLDNLPFRLAVWDGGWREAHVSVSNGELHEVLLPAPSEWEWLPRTAPHGARVPVQEQARSWIEATRASLSAGTLLAFDYCTARTAALALEPWRAWLRTYRGHERGGHYLRDPGTQDITAQVCLDQLPEPNVVRTQAQFLQRWGIDELVDEGRRAWSVAAAAPTLEALRMRSRVREAESLLDPTGLGGFLAVEWTA